ncbi:MAG: 16S rRNA (guanine(966)-N(2))-methyltransferase RsmD [Planctomycetota bacterium]
MRIIAGTHRGRKILPPKDDTTTRPITDRVRENLFNRLHSLGMFTADDGPWAVLDVFSGTGTMGIESLSRGASHCTFVDQDRDIVALLKQNLASLGETERSHIVNASALAGYWAASLSAGSVRLAFVDPPYKLVEDEATCGQVLALVERLLPTLEQGGVAVVRTPVEVELPEVAGYDGPGVAVYGGMRLHFYQSPLREDAG